MTYLKETYRNTRTGNKISKPEGIKSIKNDCLLVRVTCTRVDRIYKRKKIKWLQTFIPLLKRYIRNETFTSNFSQRFVSGWIRISILFPFLFLRSLYNPIGNIRTTVFGKPYRQLLIRAVEKLLYKNFLRQYFVLFCIRSRSNLQ